MASNLLENDDQSSTKRFRSTCTGENCSESHCSIFHDFPDYLRNGLYAALMCFIDGSYSKFEYILAYEQVSVTPLVLVVENCNGDMPYAFSEAYCSVERPEKRFLFSSLFENGIELLINFTKRKEKGVPQNRPERIILAKLLHFLLNTTEKGEDDPLQKLDSLEDDTEVTVVLANHLFGKLSTSPDFLIDQQCKWKRDNCPCLVPNCKLTGNFGDTSIGNGQVWHGNLDIIIKNDLVLQTPKEEESISPDGKSPVEVKKRGKCLQRNPRIIAETIVFSFLQKQKHPESHHYMFPCIGISCKEMVVYFYDSEHDVLLESNRISLQTALKDKPGVSVVAVVAAWLVVNHKFLCSGLMDVLKTEKAQFFSKAKSKLPVYQYKLKFGNVGTGQHGYENSTSGFPLVLDSVANRLRQKLVET